MDNRTKYEHPDFFLFLNLYFFFGDCETRDYIKKGIYVFAVSGKKAVFTSFKAGISWAYTTKLAIRTDNLIGNQHDHS